MSYKVKLEVFEGPLDLLLYLIKKDELDIYDIPITRITEQYLEYLGLMELMDLEVAGEFLVMAATLMQIKSRMLLPPDPTTVDIQEDDPRAELVKRLLEYKAFKEAAERLRGFEGQRAAVFTRVNVEPEIDGGDSPFIDVSLFDLINALAKVMKSIRSDAFHQITKDEYTVAEKVHEIFHYLVREPVVLFSKLFQSAKSKIEVITTFLALLELIRMKEVMIKQDSQFEDIEITRNIRAIEHRAADTDEGEKSDG